MSQMSAALQSFLEPFGFWRWLFQSRSEDRMTRRHVHIRLNFPKPEDIFDDGEEDTAPDLNVPTKRPGSLQLEVFAYLAYVLGSAVLFVGLIILGLLLYKLPASLSVDGVTPELLIVFRDAWAITSLILFASLIIRRSISFFKTLSD